MRQIALGKNQFALVDDEDYDWLTQWRWRCIDGYARRVYWVGSGHQQRRLVTIHMHREINQTSDGLDTDHIDRNPLNNQRVNLRAVSHSINLHNRGAQRNSASGIKGVVWDKQTSKWRAQICVHGKVTPLGRYELIEDAITARQEAERWMLAS